MSIFGDLFSIPRVPFMKNFLLIIIMVTERSNCTSPTDTGLRSKKSGNGKLHIVYPIEKYIRTISRTSEETSLDISPFSSALSVRSVPLIPYPAFITASSIALSVAVPSTVIELVRRFTAHELTPATAETAFSTRAEQAAQVIPVTENCFFAIPINSFIIILYIFKVVLSRKDRHKKIANAVAQTKNFENIY